MKLHPLFPHMYILVKNKESYNKKSVCNDILTTSRLAVQNMVQRHLLLQQYYHRNFPSLVFRVKS